MADGFSLAERRMSDLSPTFDSNVDDDETATQPDPDDEYGRDPDWIEDRFRVDRRKLEQMLQAAQEGRGEPAEEFFQRVMEETSTHITWPSKLKIGAKSKKDPHIKVGGKIDAVANAKDKIMAVLDTKSNRVTLKMDVSHTEHSHVIGKGGNNIKKVMHETACHIHFPDSNRGSTGEKSNQVSIAGQPSGVEQARTKIRELLPLVFMFELPITAVLQPTPDSSSPQIQQLQQTYNVTITFKQKPRMYVTTVIVRGSVNNAKSVKEATALLIEHLTGNIGATLPVSMQLEIAPQHHLFMIGRSGVNIKHIMQRTGASIHFPDPSTVTPARKGTVYITGGIESVCMARQQLIGCLPLVLMFDMKEDIDVDQGKVSQLMESLDVFISIKPKPKQPSRSVIVKSVERNAANMYKARQQLLGLTIDSSPVISRTTTPHTSPGSISDITGGLGLTTLGMVSHNLLNINTNPLLMMNGSISPLPSPHSSPTSTASMLSAQGLYGPMMLVSPSGTYPLQSPYPIYSQCNGFNKDMNHNSALLQDTLTHDTVHSSSCSTSVTTSPNQSPPCSSPINTFIPPNSTTPSNQIIMNSKMEHNSPLIDRKFTQTPPISDLDIQTIKAGNGFVNVIVSKNASPSNSATAADLIGLAKPGVLMKQTVVLEDNVRNIPFQNGDHRSSESGGESDGSDKRAPGTDRPMRTPPSPGTMSPSLTAGLYPNALFTAFSQIDYEQKKLLANKAMQKKPIGESRIPTDFWSGLGFSKSMPDSAIRDKLKLSGGRYQGPNMATTYEVAGQETEQCNPWRDSPSNSPGTPTPPHTPGHPHRVIKPPPGIPVAQVDFQTPHKKDSYCLSSSNHMESGCLSPATSSVWSNNTDMAELFSKLGLGKYIDLFQQQEIDMSTFLTLTDQDLRELGITTFGARRKMLLAIGDLQKNPSLFPSSSSTVHNTPFADSGANSFPRRLDIASQSGRW